MPRPGASVMLAPFPESDTAPTDLALVLHAFPTGDERLRILARSAPTAYGFSPDGKLLAIGYQDGSMKLWDLESDEEVFHADFCSQPVTQLAFTPDGALLAISDGKSAIQRLDLVALRRQLARIRLSW